MTCFSLSNYLLLNRPTLLTKLTFGFYFLHYTFISHSPRSNSYFLPNHLTTFLLTLSRKFNLFSSLPSIYLLSPPNIQYSCLTFIQHFVSYNTLKHSDICFNTSTPVFPYFFKSNKNFYSFTYPVK